MGVDRCVLTGILEGYPAENSGIRAGDEIIRINDHRVVFFRDLTSYLYLYPGKEADVTVRRESGGGDGIGRTLRDGGVWPDGFCESRFHP
jgi:regulator of sigma E protease